MSAHINILKKKFEDKKVKNNLYSLRAFSRDLDMPASKLSQLLSGKCGISEQKAEKIADLLKLNEKEKKIFVTSVTATHSRSKLAKDVAKKKLEILIKNLHQHTNIDKSMMPLFEDLNNFIILSLFDFDDFQSDLEWFKLQTGFNIIKIKKYLDRLSMYQLIDCTNKVWKRTRKKIIIEKDAHNSDLMLNFKKQTEQRIEENWKSDFGVSGNWVMSLDQNQYNQYLEVIKKFMFDLSESAANSNKNSVYLMNISFFPARTNKP